LIRKFQLTFKDRVEIREVKSDLSFGVTEAKKWLKEKHTDVIDIKHLKQ